MNYTRFLNPTSLAREPSAIQATVDLLEKSPPTMISLASGVPNPEMFPFLSAEIKLKDGSIITIDEAKMVTALNGGPTYGHTHFLKQLRALHVRFHNPPTLDRVDEESGLAIHVSSGSQDGISKAMEMLITNGDNVIIERPSYSTTLAILRPMKPNLLGIDTDRQGMIPASLRQTMSRWTPADAKDPKSTIPRVMYIIPNGQNPSGVSLTLDRKKEIYQIAREYDLLILEDDPYFLLQFSETRAPSFLSMDGDGRVIRFDTFSKVVASGIRVGYVSGPRALISRLSMHVMCSIICIPTWTQLLVSDLLDLWGLDAFEAHAGRVCDYYRDRRDVMIKSANKWLTGLAEWEVPTAGLFMWFKLNGITDTKALIMEKALEKEVLFIPGCACMPDPEAPCPYVRASYTMGTAEEIDEGLKRLGSLIREARLEA